MNAQRLETFDWFLEGRKRPPQLRTLAAWVNDHVEGYTATVKPSFTSTDRKVPGRRQRIPGKGRTGVKLTVKGPGGDVVFTHDSSHYGVINDEAVVHIARLLGHPEPQTYLWRWMGGRAR